MFAEGIFPIGDGLLDIDEERLKGLLVQDDINEIYDVEQTPFARGKFAAVRRAIHKSSGDLFAAKFLKRRRRAQSSDKEIKHEIAVLMLCDGAENIVKLNAVHESRSDTALLLELATGGELQTFLDREECLNESQARICMREVLKALQFLHKRSIVHLDLKPQNILLTGNRIEDGLKLCDFGISRVVAEGTNVREIVGTPDYVAPEVLQYEPLSLMTDIWSVGVLAYVLLSGFSPFGGETKQETFLNISQCALTFPDKLFGGVSSMAIDFIRRSLRIKPNDRMSAAGCLEHNWLKDECSIDRQIFNNISKNSTKCDNDDVDDVDDDEEDDDDDDVDVDVDIDVEQDESEEYDEISIEDNAGMNGSRMDSSDVERDALEILSNGKAHNSKATTNVIAAKYTNGVSKQQQQQQQQQHNGKLMTTTLSTAVHAIPATRATIIPLCDMQQQQQQQPQQPQQQQQQIQFATRRHSSDSNKENTYLATKNIVPSIAKKPIIVTAPPTANGTSVATLIVAPNAELTTAMITSNNVATITLPNGSGSCEKLPTAAQCCLFPDAPTTPKVIRKAPTTETSPTSVKALVKKFQLEGNNADKHAMHLKETQINQQQPTQQQQQQQQQQQPHQQPKQQSQQLQYNYNKQQQQQLTNGLNNSSSNSRKSVPPADTTAASASAATNGKMHVKINEKCTINNEHNKKFTSYSNSSNNNGVNNFNKNSNIFINSNNSRRLSEPITAVHKKIPPTSPTSSTASNGSNASNASTASAASAPGIITSNVANYKTTCVFCLTYNGGASSKTNSRISGNNVSNTGCGHSAATITNGVRDSGSNNGGNLNNSVNKSPSLATVATTTTETTKGATVAVLINSQQHHASHHHHQHHRHHHVAKNAANNLSLDQGIIC